jgi:hypothetical protein
MHASAYVDVAVIDQVLPVVISKQAASASVIAIVVDAIDLDTMITGIEVVETDLPVVTLLHLSSIDQNTNGLIANAGNT